MEKIHIDKSVQLLAYTDDIDIIGFNNRAASSTFSRLDKKAKRTCLVVNEYKTKYFLLSNKQSAHPRLGPHATSHVPRHVLRVITLKLYINSSTLEPASGTPTMSALKSNVELIL